MIFAFKATRQGPVLAQAQKVYGLNRPMNLWINKQRQTPLEGGFSVIQQAEKLLHQTLNLTSVEQGLCERLFKKAAQRARNGTVLAGCT